MSTTPDSSTDTIALLALRAESRERRLHFWWLAMVACGAALIYSFGGTWYHATFDGDVTPSLRADAVQVSATVEVTARDMATMEHTHHRGIANPAVGTVAGIPNFYMFTFAAIVVAAFGLFIASGALTALSLAGFGYAWTALNTATYGFENATGRDGWTIVAGSGQQLYGFVVAVAMLLAVTGAIQAIAFQRAERAVRVARNEPVEETFSERLERFVSRGGPARHDPADMAGG